MAGQSLRDPQKTVALCAKVTGKYYNDCITGAVNIIIDFWGAKMGDKPYALVGYQRDCRQAAGI